MSKGCFHHDAIEQRCLGALVEMEGLPANPVLQQRLIAMGVRPGAEIEVVRRGKPGGILHLACGFLEFMLRHEHAREMTVRPCQP
jgi:ferrous iron transport protein A